MILAEKNGVKLEDNENGFILTAANGTRLRLDRNGELIEKIDYEPWRKYFFKMTLDELLMVACWCKEFEPKTEKQEEFKNMVKKAMHKVNYQYEIAIIEPVTDIRGNIDFEEGVDVYGCPRAVYWIQKAKEFAPKYNSGIATLEELYLFYAYRIAMRYWTIEYVCDDSSSDGNYDDSPISSKKKDKAGENIVGGFMDGIGNTRKLVIKDEVPTLVGGAYGYSGKKYPVAYLEKLEGLYSIDSIRMSDEVSGVVVLRTDRDFYTGHKVINH